MPPEVHYCPDHDPMLRAGILTCPACGRVSYPTDAIWLDPRLTMATYPAPCEHTRGGTVVGDPADLGPNQLWCQAPTRGGDPCRNRRPADGGPCYVHRGDR